MVSTMSDITSIQAQTLAEYGPDPWRYEARRDHDLNDTGLTDADIRVPARDFGERRLDG